MLNNALQQLCFTGFLLAGLWSALIKRIPDETSFERLRESNYGRRDANSSSLPFFVMTDKSMSSKVSWSRYVDHGPVVLASVHLKSRNPRSASKPAGIDTSRSAKSKSTVTKLYEHRYLGILGFWLPLPYMPRPGNKPGVYAVGACILGHCVCMPKLNQPRSGSKTPPPKAVNKSQECWVIKSTKSASLNVMAIPNIILFLMWQWPSNWASLGQHATLSASNLARGHFWVLLSAPFSHQHWSSIFHTGVLLASTLDTFDRAGVSFVIFLMLYLVGSWAAWLARTVLVRGIWHEDECAYYTQECGAAGGLAAQLMFLARIRPEERFSFSIYMIPTPLVLRAWQSCLAHGVMDIFQQSGRGTLRQVCAHLAAWSIGWLLAGAWQKHE